METLPPDIDDIVFNPTMWADMRAVVTPIVEPILREAYALGAELAALQPSARPRIVTAQRDYEPEVIDALAQSTARAQIEDWWGQFTSTTQREMQRQILRARAEGRGTQWLMEQLEPMFGATRALRIATTEITRLMGAGAQATYRQMGYPGWEWRTVRDKAVCSTCHALNNVQYPQAVPFQPAHVGCRCWPVPVTSPTTLRMPMPASTGLLRAG